MTTPSRPEPHGMGIWWTILLVGAATSLYLNIWHAVTIPAPTGHPDAAGEAAGQAAKATTVGGVILAVTYGLIPVLFAALLSHGFVNPLVGAWPRRVIVALFLIGMAMSLSAQAAVMQPYGGDVGRWGIPIILDVSALIALHVITKAASVATASGHAADTAADMAALREAARREAEADIRAQAEAAMAARLADITTRMEADTATRRTAMEADMATALAAAEADIQRTLEADMAARTAAMTTRPAASRPATKADMAASEAATEAAIRRQATADMAAPRAAVKADTATGEAATTAAMAARPAATDGPTSKDRARQLLATQPDMTAADLGAALGLSTRTGRRLLRELGAEVDMATGEAAMTAPDRADIDADTATTEADEAAMATAPQADMAARPDVAAPDRADIPTGHVRLHVVQ